MDGCIKGKVKLMPISLFLNVFLIRDFRSSEFQNRQILFGALTNVETLRKAFLMKLVEKMPRVCKNTEFKYEIVLYV